MIGAGCCAPPGVPLSLGTSQFGMSLVQTVFMFYYVKVFLNVFHIDHQWFQLAQLLFLLWNTINDPLFGMIQDLGGPFWRDRRRIIMLLSPFLAGSFLLLWFPWTTTSSSLTGLHLITALFLYDGFYSFVSVAWSGFFADATRDHVSRVRAVQASQIAILLSVNVLALTEWFSHSLENLAAFQSVAVVVALLCVSGCSFTGLFTPPTISADSSPSSSSQPAISPRVLFYFSKQIFSSPDFLRTTMTNFVHTCRSVAHLNFAAITTEVLIPSHVLAKGSWQISAFYGLCTLLPQLLVICNNRLVIKYGPSRLLMLSFYLSLFAGLAAFFLAANSPHLILLFILIDSIAVHSLAPMFHILFADVVDDDMRRYNRRTRLSSLIFSLNSFLVKPSQSLAPMVIVYILQQADYQQFESSRDVSDALRNTMFYLLCLIPVVLSSIQLFLFRNYSLGDKHLTDAHLCHL